MRRCISYGFAGGLAKVWPSTSTGVNVLVLTKGRMNITDERKPEPRAFEMGLQMPRGVLLEKTQDVISGE